MELDRKKIFIIVGLFLIFVIGGIALLVLGGEPPVTDASLEFWTTFEDPDFYDEAVRGYERANPHVKISFREFTFEDYEKSLIDAFAAGSGPDIWMMHNTWLPKHRDKIVPLPEKIKGRDEPLFTIKQFKEQFVDVAISDLTDDGVIYALPLYVDTLALYYNKNIFNTAQIASPPKTWHDFNRDATFLTVRDSKNNITRSAVALGTSRTVNRSTDILSMMMLQNGTRMTDDDRRSATFSKSVGGIQVGENALQYYTNFANPAKTDLYTWNDDQKYSIDAFTDQNTAMMFNYSHHVDTLKNKAPRLDFAVAPVPQPEGADIDVTYANYWAPTVAKQSPHALEAWKFLTYLATTKAADSYIEFSHRPAARRDIIESQTTDPELGVFAQQTLTARSWYQADNTAIETIFAKMIDDVNSRLATSKDALEAAEDKVNVLMRER